MSTEESSAGVFKGPAYALVIGISKHKHGKDYPEGSDQVTLGEKEFPNLTYAAKDAEDFAAFLKDHGFTPGNVRLLLNDEADKQSIEEGFDRLIRECRRHRAEAENEEGEGREDGPLVIVYFSGHGWVDSLDRQYLIPYDAECDRLFSTAIRQHDFDGMLNNIETNRRVVFIDACHSGSIVRKGTKGPLPSYDPARELGGGEGQYVIASCGPNQKSYEHEEEPNSIFTHHLLELLKCESDAIRDEEITTFSLYNALSKEVKKTAARFDHEQEPYAADFGGTGIVLAINQRVRRERLASEQADREAQEREREERHQVLGVLRLQYEKQDPPGWFLLLQILKSYVNGKPLDPARYKDLYKCFRDCAAAWKPNQSEEEVGFYCGSLIEAYQEAQRKHQQSKEKKLEEAAKPVETVAQEHTKPADKLEAEPKSTVVAPETPAAPKATAPPPADQQQQAERRQFSDDDQTYILGEIQNNGDYWNENKELMGSLLRPVSKDEFTRRANGILKNAMKRNDAALEGIVQRIFERFSERWPHADIAETRTVNDLLLRR